jgi:hypothetical protein
MTKITHNHVAIIRQTARRFTPADHQNYLR